MKKTIKLTESELTKLIKKVMNEDNSLEFNRRFAFIDEHISDLIALAEEDMDEDDFGDYYDYLENVVYWVVQELQSRYGDKDDFWYDREDEITDYIKDKFF